MKISLSNITWANSPINYDRHYNYQDIPKDSSKYLYVPKDTVSFQHSSKIPLSAIEYLNEQKKQLKNHPFGDLSKYLCSYDAQRLEGLQNGIEIFDGLTFPQIAYLITRFESIPLQRGCHNGCIHCMVNAPPHISEIDFEDYQKLINGFKELNKRLGFKPLKHYLGPYYLFYDSDCSTIYLKDKKGRIYDYADLAKMLHDVSEKRILFDTAGWNPNDKITQKRMEDLVKKIKKRDKYNFLKFNISINPFHSIYNKSVELAENGDLKNSKKLREIYTDRIANAIFTFSPLIDKENSIRGEQMLNFIIRALDPDTICEGYGELDLKLLLDEILTKLEDMYSKDLISISPKVVKNQEQKERYLNYIKSCFVFKNIGTFIYNNKLLNKLKKISPKELEYIANNTHDSANEGKKFKAGIIDLNGILYVTNYVETYPTNISLNFKNKNRATSRIEPNPRDDVIII